MSTPGAGGTRLHVHGLTLSSLALPASPPHCQPSYILPLPATARPPHVLFFAVAQPQDLDGLPSTKCGAALTLPLEGVPAALPLLSRARALGLPTHVTLLRCFRVAPGGHPDVNSAARLVEDAGGALADGGAGVVALRDCDDAATEESLREAVEAAFNLDVAGEAVMERLSVGVGNLALAKAALGLGVTRLEVGGRGLLAFEAAAHACKPA